jgi:hypothetical protein
MDDTNKQGKGQSLELMRDEFTMQEICVNKFVPKIREKKKQQQIVMHIGQMKNNVWSLHRKKGSTGKTPS